MGCRRAERRPAAAVAVACVAVVAVAGVAVVAAAVTGVALAFQVGGVFAVRVPDGDPPVDRAAVAVVAGELFLCHDRAVAVAAGADLSLVAAAVVLVPGAGFGGSGDGECECGAQECDQSFHNCNLLCCCFLVMGSAL